jgi:hypothetical protein
MSSDDALPRILQLIPSLRDSGALEAVIAAAQTQQQLIHAQSLSEPPARSAQPCRLAAVVDAVAATLIGSCLSDDDAHAWAQCSRRSLQQLQRRSFLSEVTLQQAMKLAEPEQRCAAAFGMPRRVCFGGMDEWWEMDPSQVEEAQDVGTAAPSLRLPGLVTELHIGHPFNTRRARLLPHYLLP